MNKSIVFVAMLSTSSVFAADNTHWGYSGSTGPEHWAELSADNYSCTGSNQSPINLTGFIDADLDPIKFNYLVGANEVINNGHTIQVNYQRGSSIEIESQTFNLLQAHFHSPSENNINGQSYPLEAHFVHANEDGALAVIAVMYQEGIPNQGLKIEFDKYQRKTIRATTSANKTLKQIWSVMPTKLGDKYQFTEMINLDSLLPKNRDHYQFNGSLTTPPCSEGVLWLVMKEPVVISKKQIQDFSDIIPEANNRPLQAINYRRILE